MIIDEHPVGTLYGEEEIEAVRRVIESGDALTRGPDVELFEKEFADYCGAKYAVAISSCGAALQLSSKILNLGSNDEVICQANAFWVTYNHLLEKNVKIICADIDPLTLNIDVDKIEALITSKTKAIYIIHHGGNPADLDPLRSIVKKYNLDLVEDAAHAVGAEYKGQKIGANSDIACFSFSTLKNISTLGEGGMLVTNNKEYADLAIGFRTNYPSGLREKRDVNGLGEVYKPKSIAYKHSGDAWEYNWLRLDQMGSTYRMSTVQGAVGRVQLQKLDDLIRKRERIAQSYNDIISRFDCFEKLKVLPNCKHAWHLFSFFVKDGCSINRDTLLKKLYENYNINIVLRFFPINLGGILRSRGCKEGGCRHCNGLKHVEDVWFNKQMSLPISPQITQQEIEYIQKSLVSSIGVQ